MAPIELEDPQHSDASSLDRIGQALRSNGWQADLTSGTNVANGYEGRLQIHSSGS